MHKPFRVESSHSPVICSGLKAKQKLSILLVVLETNKLAVLAGEVKCKPEYSWILCERTHSNSACFNDLFIPF